jgi:hypothetical protein
MATHGVLKGVESCKSIGNRGDGKDLAKVAYKRASCVQHDANAWCTVNMRLQSAACHSEFKDQQQTQQVQTVYFGNWKLMALLNRLLACTIALVVMPLFVWQNNAELIITTGSQALSSSGAQKKNRNSISI